MEQKERKMKIEGVAHAELNGGETSSSRLGIEKDTPDIQSFSPAQNESLRKDMKTETSKDDVDVKQKEKMALHQHVWVASPPFFVDIR
ncbi:MAG: hypothetical protein MJZ10_13550, partial [Fibrobacter sp.]|nr:hypothetical protein [Fibrobacter sp.]